MAYMKNAVFYLDGAIFNLNALRYHYYALLCRSYGLPVNKEEFYNYLDSKQDKEEDVLALEEKIEDYVHRYCKKHGTPINLGVKEFLSYLKTQNTQVIIYTTLDIKEAYEILKEEKLTKYVHRIYSKTDPIFEDSQDPIQTILQHEQSRIVDTLVFTGNEREGSHYIDLGFNVVLVKDMISDIHYRGRYFYNSVDLSNMIAKLIIDKHDPLDLFSPILGFNKKMDRQELDQRYALLCEHFKNDQKLLMLTKQTYDQLCEVVKMDIPVIQTNYSLENSLTLEHDDLFVKPEPVLKIEPVVEEKVEEVQVEEIIVEETIEDEIVVQTKEEVVEETIKEEIQPKEELEDVEIEEEESSFDDETPVIYQRLFEAFYCLFNAILFSLIFILVAIVFALGFYPYLESKLPFLSILEKGYQVFHQFSYVWVQLIYQSFASVFNLESYDVMIRGNETISSFGIQVLIYMVTICCIYLIVVGSMKVYKSSKK